MQANLLDHFSNTGVSHIFQDRDDGSVVIGYSPYLSKKRDIY